MPLIKITLHNLNATTQFRLFPGALSESCLMSWKSTAVVFILLSHHHNRVGTADRTKLFQHFQRAYHL